MKIGGSTAWRSITQPISDRSLSDALVGLPAPARDSHRASSSCPQASQRQIVLRGEGNWASPSKRICPTPTWNGFRLARCFARRAIPTCPDLIRLNFEEATDAGERQESNAKWERIEKDSGKEAKRIVGGRISGKRIVGKGSWEKDNGKGSKRIVGKG